MKARHLALVPLIGLASIACGDVTLRVDYLTDDEGETRPPGVLVFDILADVSDDDAWTAAGLRVEALQSATLIYARDPNNNEIVLTNPGTGNRFVTCLSRPRPRSGNARFANAEAAVVGRYCPTGPIPTTSASELNVAWFASPPANPATPSADGAIARIAIQAGFSGFCQGGGCCSAGLFPADAMPPSHLALLRCTCIQDFPFGMCSSTFDNPTLVGESWVFAVHAYLPCLYDVNRDEAESVDLEDLASLLAAFGTCIGDPGYNGFASFDGDGCVDLDDLATFLPHFGELCCID